MDLFMEYLVKRKRSSKDMIISMAIILAAMILLSLSTIMMSVQALAGLWLFVAAGIIFFAVMFIKRQSVEFEYILTNNELDIDKISARSTRKRIITINFTGIDICAPVSHNQFNNKSGIAKTIDCTGDGEKGVYFVDFTSDSGKTRVLFQPPVSYIESVRRFNPSKIFID